LRKRSTPVPRAPLMLFSPIEEHREDTTDFAERLRKRILFGIGGEPAHQRTFN
jgi:hypothetical protein